MLLKWATDAAIFQIPHSRVAIQNDTTYFDLYNEWFPCNSNVTMFSSK